MFALLAEPGFHNFKKLIGILFAQGRTVKEIDPHDGRVHVRLGVERAGWNMPHDFWCTVELHTHCQHAHLRRRGADALGYFALNGEDDETRPHWRFEQMAEDGRGDVIRNIRNDFVLGFRRSLASCAWGLETCPERSRRIRDYRLEIDFEYVAVNEGDIGEVAGGVLEDGEEAVVEFDGDDAGGGLRKGAGEAPGSGCQSSRGFTFGGPCSASAALCCSVWSPVCSWGR